MQADLQANAPDGIRQGGLAVLTLDRLQHTVVGTMAHRQQPIDRLLIRVTNCFQVVAEQAGTNADFRSRIHRARCQVEDTPGSGSKSHRESARIHLTAFDRSWIEDAEKILKALEMKRIGEWVS